MKNKFSTLLVTFVCVVLTVGLTYGQDAKKVEKRSISTSATDRIAPFISNDVFLVVRFDFDALDSEQIINTVDSIFLGYLKERGFDSKRSLQTNREFKRGLEELRSQIDAILDLRQTLSVRELFIIVQNQTDNSARFFIPMSASKKSIVQSALLEDFPALKFVDLPGGIGFVSDPDKDKAIYRKFEPRPNPRLKKFFEESAGSTIQIYSSSINFSSLSGSFGSEIKESFAQLPPETSKAFASLDSYFQELRVSVDLNKLTINVAIVFTTAERAEEFRKSLDKLFNFLVDDYFKNHPELMRDFFPNLTNEEIEKYNLHNLAREITRAAVLKMVPERDGATLSLRFTPDSKDALRNSCLLQVPLVPALIDQLSRI